MEIYEVSSDDYLREMVEILIKAAREISDAVKILETYPMLPWNTPLQPNLMRMPWRRPITTPLLISSKDRYRLYAENEGDLSAPQQRSRSK